MKIHTKAVIAMNGTALFFVSITQFRTTHDPGEFRNDAKPATIIAETPEGLPAPLVHHRARRSR
jgi:hypothetical protein